MGEDHINCIAGVSRIFFFSIMLYLKKKKKKVRVTTHTEE